MAGKNATKLRLYLKHEIKANPKRETPNSKQKQVLLFWISDTDGADRGSMSNEMEIEEIRRANAPAIRCFL
jgi:hypothetical protein